MHGGASSVHIHGSYLRAARTASRSFTFVHMTIPFPLFMGLSVALLFSACSAETPDSDAPSAMPALPSANSAAPASGSSAVDANSSAQLNPPHGEPGHVCEIPVGQPLDGSGGTNTPPEATQSLQMGNGMDMAPQTMTIPDQSTSTQTLPSGTPNPAHGEPGHVCAVSVGAPLP